MNITHDRENDSLYIQLTDERFETNKRINERFILDIDANGDVIGIEILDVSKWVANSHDIRITDITRQNHDVSALDKTAP